LRAACSTARTEKPDINNEIGPCRFDRGELA
jgi:hypothetical protein